MTPTAHETSVYTSPCTQYNNPTASGTELLAAFGFVTGHAGTTFFVKKGECSLYSTHRKLVQHTQCYCSPPQIDNGIPIESWFDDKSDEELLHLLPLLKQLISESETAGGNVLLSSHFFLVCITRVWSTRLVDSPRPSRCNHEEGSLVFFTEIDMVPVKG